MMEGAHIVGGGAGAQHHIAHLDIVLDTAGHADIDDLIHTELIDEQQGGVGCIDLAHAAGHQYDLAALAAAS